jgi:hypothetical protein
MTKSRRLLLPVGVLAILVAALVGVAQASVYEGAVEITCAGFDATGTGAHILDRDNTGVGQERLRIVAYDGAGTMIFELVFQNLLGSYSGGIGDFSWDTAPQYNPITWQLWSLAGNGLPLQLDYETTGECAGLPLYEGPVLPGCDALLPIPATAVGGTFVADAPVYWAPGDLATPLVTIPAGNSARVIGLDASGQYYKIIWVCDFVWVPVGTLGPNYDAVWNGAPLPTAVVE